MSNLYVVLLTAISCPAISSIAADRGDLKETDAEMLMGGAESLWSLSILMLTKMPNRSSIYV